MRYLRLKAIPFYDDVKDGQGNQLMFSYADQVRVIMRTPSNPQAGADIGEIERSLRILSRAHNLEDGDMLELEDADWQYLCERVQSQRWLLVDPAVVAFKADVDAAPTAALQSLEPAASV